MKAHGITPLFSSGRGWLRGFAAVLAFATFAIASPGAQAGVFVSVSIAPPALPVYVQPAIPGAGYIWAPGYWAYADGGYYWVPGTWVLAPYVGALWTPGYWGWAPVGFYWVPGVWCAAPYYGALWTPGYWGFYQNRYRLYPGFWGSYVGFYGGINYGFGYYGSGYRGGYWDGRC